MKRTHKNESGTRERLLEAACEVFAQRGYSDATIAEICERGEANIAAVNYHFGSKEALYVEAWRVAFHRSLAANPPDGGVDPAAPAAERLRGLILSLVRRLSGPEAHEFEIMHKELANPTGLLVEVVRESIEPIRQKFLTLVKTLLGPKASSRQVQLCQYSIRSQCFDLMAHQQHRRQFRKAGLEPMPFRVDFDVEELTDHITRFSLAGIRELRRQIEAGEVSEEATA